MKRKILVCGATGFIGRNIAEFFSNSDEVDVYGTFHTSKPLDNPRIKMIQADLTNREDVERALKGMDIVIQAAAVTSGVKDIVSKPYIHVTDNAIMNALLFRAAYQHKISHVIFFSCTVMYQASATAVKETDFDARQEMLPSYFGAGWTKVYSEKMCEFYSRIAATKYTVVRHSNIYGPFDKYDLERSHVFGATMTKVMNAKEGSDIVMWGTGEEARDLLYVSDLVHFVEMAIEKQMSNFEIFNVGCGYATSVKDLVRKIIAHSGKNIAIKHDATQPTIKTTLCVDSTKAKRMLGWVPQVSLDEGIKKTMQWYRKTLRGNNDY